MILKQNIFSIIILVLLVAVFVLSITLFFAALSKKSRIESEIASKCEAINNFVEKSKMPMTKESVGLLGEERARLNKIYSRFKLALASPLNKEVPQEELEPLQFKERLIQSQKRIRQDARKRNLSLPGSLGFTKYETELSKPFEIPDLIKQLKVLEELVQIMALSGIDSLDEIKFAGKEAKTGTYFNIPVSLKIDCATLELIAFIYELGSSPFIFVIDDLDIERVQTGKLKANFAIKTIAIN